MNPHSREHLIEQVVEITARMNRLADDADVRFLREILDRRIFPQLNDDERSIVQMILHLHKAKQQARRNEYFNYWFDGT